MKNEESEMCAGAAAEILAPATARAEPLHQHASTPAPRHGAEHAETQARRENWRKRNATNKERNADNGNAEHDVPLPCIGSHEAVSAAPD